MRRWGMRWVSAAEADGKWKQSKVRAEEYDRLARDARRAEDRTAKAYAAIAELRIDLRRHSNAEIRAIHDRWTKAKATETRLRDEANQARSRLSSTELPEFPKYLRFIPIDAVTPDRHPTG